MYNSLSFAHMMSRHPDNMGNKDIEAVDAQFALLTETMASRRLGYKAPSQKGRARTKIARAREIYRSDPTRSREDMIKAFIEKADLSEDGAVSYLSKIRQEAI